MLTFPLTATDEQLLQAVEKWIGLLVQERYDEAFGMFYRQSPLDDGWSPALIRALVENYGSPEPSADGPVCHVTSIAETSGGRPQPYRKVYRFEEEDGVEGYIHFDLPLDGKWSDVTAVFDVWKMDDKLVLHLEGMHVL
jgi:hypothetical protein